MITPSFGLTATERVLPKLALDFTTSSLDGRITFTRTTGASNPATYVNSSGVITAATNNQPRFDYDPVTLACKGLLIEEQRTNALVRSEEINDVSWSKGANATIVPNDAVSPDGNTTADKVVVSAVSGQPFILQNVVAVIGATYTVSLYAKYGGLDLQMYFGSNDISGGNYRANFDLQNGILGDFDSQLSPTIKDAGNGWYRCTVTATSAVTTNFGVAYMPIQSLSATRAPTYTGDGTSGIYLWGAQLEAGAFATSYIPTTLLPLTRNADVATMTGTNFSDWFNASEGTFVAQYIPKNPAPSNACGLFIADDGTGNNLVGVSVTSSLRGILSLATGGSGAGALAANSGTVNQVNKVAGSFKVNDYAVALNGGTVATSTALALPTVTQARIGFLARTGLYANAHIQKLAFYPVRGINAQVQAQSK